MVEHGLDAEITTDEDLGANVVRGQLVG
jgi:hypothetical protein